MNFFNGFDLEGLRERSERSQEKEASAVVLDRGVLKVMVLARTTGDRSCFFIELSIFPGADRGPLDPAMMRRACSLISELHSLGYMFYHDGSLIIAERGTSADDMHGELSMRWKVITKLEGWPARPAP